jgi:UDP-3-O-[3-hydroxymyristoyl] N-acetylglucosamine deacetylase
MAGPLMVAIASSSGSKKNSNDAKVLVMPESAIAQEFAQYEHWAEQQVAQAMEVVRSPYQHTLSRPFHLEGIGLHTGETVAVTVSPAPVNLGRSFIRTDLDSITIPAQIQSLHQTVLSTELSAGNATLRTVEHLLAALLGLGIDNASIEVNGPEIPLLDGSAQAWATQILRAGWTQQTAQRQFCRVTEPIVVQQGDAFVAALPAEQTRLTYGIDFSHAAIGQQWQSVLLEDFLMAIAPARTFGLAEDIETLRQGGLIKGGSLENALVCDTKGWLNPPLRYPNEPVRHKLLDLIGDLSLLGTLPKAHIWAYKASHALHTRLAQRLADLQDSSH